MFTSPFNGSTAIVSSYWHLSIIFTRFDRILVAWYLASVIPLWSDWIILGLSICIFELNYSLFLHSTEFMKMKWGCMDVQFLVSYNWTNIGNLMHLSFICWLVYAQWISLANNFSIAETLYKNSQIQKKKKIDESF